MVQSGLQPTHPGLARREATLSGSVDHQVHDLSWADFSVLLCAGFLLAICVAGPRHELKSSWVSHGRLALLISMWFWTSTTWATETKMILTTFTSDRSDPGFPLLGFWLTFTPQIASSAVCLFVMFWQFSVSSAHETRARALMARGQSFWLVGGAAYWYGQFFTVQSLVFGSPVLTFIVKATEPLSTALLAVVVLRKPFSRPLVLGVFVACLGIMVTVISAERAYSSGSASPNSFGSHAQLGGMVFALLGNLGFSSRSCVAKKALTHLHLDAFEIYSMTTIAGTQIGLLPILGYGIAGRLAGSTAVWALPFFDPRFSAWSWFMMSLSYIVYQTASMLVLSSLAVESHALLVAMKHVLVVVLVAVLMHVHLTKGMLLGMAVALLGVYIYMGSTKDSAMVPEGAGEEVPLTRHGHLPKAVAAWQVPTPLRAIVCAVVVLGSITPPALAVLGIHSAADL